MALAYTATVTATATATASAIATHSVSRALDTSHAGKDAIPQVTPAVERAACCHLSLVCAYFIYIYIHLYMGKKKISQADMTVRW